MNKEMEDTVLKVADYTNTEAQNHNKRVHRLFLFAIVFYSSLIISSTTISVLTKHFKKNFIYKKIIINNIYLFYKKKNIEFNFPFVFF